MKTITHRSLKYALTSILMSMILLAFFGITNNSYAQSFCYTFNTDLKVGSVGSDVDALHTILSREGFSRAYTWSNITPTNTFNEETASLVSGFQEKYRNEILGSLGYRYGTGYVGAQTRNKLNALYSCSSTGNTGQTPVISGIQTPTTLRANETGTWIVSAYDPQNSSLTYSVQWGDEGYYNQGYNPITPNTAGYWNSQQASFTHSYTNPGTYTVRFKVRDTQGYEAESSATITVSGYGTGGNTSDLRLISPNGGQWLRSGASFNITWQMPYVQYFAAQSTDIKLIPATNVQPQNNSCPVGSTCAYTGNNYSGSYTGDAYFIARGVYGSSYNWNVGSTAYYWTTVPPGTYFVEVCLNNSTACDRSDSTVVIY